MPGSNGLGLVDSGCHKPSENICFVWSKRSYSGQKVGCDECDGRTDGNVKIVLESLKQDSQFATQFIQRAGPKDIQNNITNKQAEQNMWSP